MYKCVSSKTFRLCHYKQNYVVCMLYSNNTFPTSFTFLASICIRILTGISMWIVLQSGTLGRASYSCHRV